MYGNVITHPGCVLYGQGKKQDREQTDRRPKGCLSGFGNHAEFSRHWSENRWYNSDVFYLWQHNCPSFLTFFFQVP